MTSSFQYPPSSSGNKSLQRERNVEIIRKQNRAVVAEWSKTLVQIQVACVFDYPEFESCFEPALSEILNGTLDI